MSSTWRKRLLPPWVGRSLNSRKSSTHEEGVSIVLSLSFFSCKRKRVNDQQKDWSPNKWSRSRVCATRHNNWTDCCVSGRFNSYLEINLVIIVKSLSSDNCQNIFKREPWMKMKLLFRLDYFFVVAITRISSWLIRKKNVKEIAEKSNGRRILGASLIIKKKLAI